MKTTERAKRSTEVNKKTLFKANKGKCTKKQ